VADLAPYCTSPKGDSSSEQDREKKLQLYNVKQEKFSSEEEQPES